MKEMGLELWSDGVLLTKNINGQLWCSPEATQKYIDVCLQQQRTQLANFTVNAVKEERLRNAMIVQDAAGLALIGGVSPPLRDVPLTALNLAEGLLRCAAAIMKEDYDETVAN